MISARELLRHRDYTITIPTRGRSHLLEKRMGVWKYLSGEYDKSLPVFALVREEEMEDYENAMGDICDGSIIEVPNDYHICDKRNLAIQNCNTEYCIIVDDDVTFSYRDEDLSSKYASKIADVLEKDIFCRILYESTRLCCEKYPIVGLPSKHGSFALKYMFQKNAHIIRFVCYHIPTLQKEGIRANKMRTKLSSDRFVQMDMLSKGYTSLSNGRFTVSDMGIDKVGGCNVFRSAEERTESAMELHKWFPEYTTLKRNKEGWVDCGVRWGDFTGKDELRYLPKEYALEIIRRGGFYDTELK